jgi:hypothetical protein
MDTEKAFDKDLAQPRRSYSTERAVSLSKLFPCKTFQEMGQNC